MRTVFVIALMSSQGCGVDVICWKPIRQSPEYRTRVHCETAVSLLNELDLRKFKCVKVRR